MFNWTELDSSSSSSSRFSLSAFRRICDLHWLTMLVFESHVERGEIFFLYVGIRIYTYGQIGLFDLTKYSAATYWPVLSPTRLVLVCMIDVPIDEK